MLASIFYMISFFLFFISLCVYPKTYCKISLLNMVILSYISQLCIGAVAAEILSLFKVAVNIQSMGIIWFILSIVVFGGTIYKKQIQKVFIKVSDIYAIFILTLFFVYLFNKIFSHNFNWIYTTTDPSVHYKMAQNVMKTGKIEAMYFTALYNGLLMEVFSPFINEINLYKVFILSDTFFNYINLFMCYIWMCSVCKHNKTKWIIPFLCIFYFLGWPLSSYAYYGFVYFGMGTTLYAYVLYLIYIADRQILQIDKKLIYFFVVIGTFNITVCYMLFTPILVGTILLYLIITQRQYFSTKAVIKALPAILILFGILFYIAFFGYFHGDISKIFSGFRLDGGIQKHLFEDFIFLMPFVVYILIKKRKCNHILSISMSVLMLIILVSFCIACIGYMSGYYYYKLYYPLWFLCWVLLVMAFEELYCENQVLLMSTSISFVFAFIIMWTGIEGKLPLGLGGENSGGLFPIYQSNRQLIYNPDEYLINDRKEIRDLTVYIRDTLGDREKVPIIYGHRAYHLGNVWYQALTECESFDYDDNMEDILSKIVREYNYFAVSEEVIENNENILQRYTELSKVGKYILYAIP